MRITLLHQYKGIFVGKKKVNSNYQLILISIEKRILINIKL